MIFDNLLSNSKRAFATKVNIAIQSKNNRLEVEYSDNGRGLNKTFVDNPEEIFESKVTTTEGAGWGLYYVKDILKKMKSDISVVSQKKGIKFIIIFNKKLK